jgi:isoprenylcysteine carboxyl methyltransferase (ICMT) family protein YpbQ
MLFLTFLLSSNLCLLGSRPWTPNLFIVSSTCIRSKQLFRNYTLSVILKLTFLKIAFLKSLLFKIVKAFGKIC